MVDVVPVMASSTKVASLFGRAMGVMREGAGEVSHEVAAELKGIGHELGTFLECRVEHIVPGVLGRDAETSKIHLPSNHPVAECNGPTFLCAFPDAQLLVGCHSVDGPRTVILCDAGWPEKRAEAWTEAGGAPQILQKLLGTGADQYLLATGQPQKILAEKFGDSVAAAWAPAGPWAASNRRGLEWNARQYAQNLNQRRRKLAGDIYRLDANRSAAQQQVDNLERQINGTKEELDRIRAETNRVGTTKSALFRSRGLPRGAVPESRGVVSLAKHAADRQDELLHRYTALRGKCADLDGKLADQIDNLEQMREAVRTHLRDWSDASKDARRLDDQIKACRDFPLAIMGHPSEWPSLPFDLEAGKYPNNTYYYLSVGEKPK